MKTSHCHKKALAKRRTGLEFKIRTFLKVGSKKLTLNCMSVWISVYMRWQINKKLFYEILNHILQIHVLITFTDYVAD